MKKYLLFPLCLFALLSSQAQITTLDGNPRWLYQMFTGSHQPTNQRTQLMLGADTTINQTTYKKVGDAYNNHAFLREDAHVVYIVMPQKFSGEKKLFDYNLEAGDIIDTSVFYFNGMAGVPNDTLKVNLVDSIWSPGGYRKEFFFNSGFWIIEGVGSIYQYPFFMPYYGSQLSGGYELACYEQYGTNQEVSGMAGTTSCPYLSVGEHQVYVPQIYPNPAKEELYIEMGEGDVQTIKLISIDGRLVETYTISESGQSSIHIQHLDAGVYILQGNGWIQKIIKE